MENNTKPITLNQLIQICKENGIDLDKPIICTADCDKNPLLFIRDVGLAFSEDGEHDAILFRLACVGKMKTIELPDLQRGIDWNALLKNSYGKGGPKS